MKQTQNGMQRNELNDIECIQMHDSLNAFLSNEQECNYMTVNEEILE